MCVLACLFRARTLLNTCFNDVNCSHVHTDSDRYYKTGVMGRHVYNQGGDVDKRL